ncbi:P2X purinoceptor 7-like [Bombina bombina]|uniref:P2X purinoceptor 7-like n=1 Tax=Bombina bombina TaxID=8345 RepID=UPI00235A5A0D|nr:P2X purinoceptor 7-like [Bombina bombina]XP_053561610.1 P2X purinoceptor 7-like [Bombina bombina]XP_053567300.1 P2X purinoceptor 7-like [Bombina bombina]XP_053567990.1 P2X purinoceptor 7-like [Bombina bombina]
MASNYDNLNGRTLLELSQQEVQDMMQTLIAERNAEIREIDVSQSDQWDPRRSVEELERESSADDSENQSYSIDENSIRLENLEWCLCGNCQLMPSIIESICCREKEEILYHIPDGKSCICESENHIHENDQGFLNRVAQIIGSLGPMRSQSRQAITQRAYRKLSYRAFSTWINGEMGPRNRKPIPSCVVNSIRRRFPAPDNIYVGFHYPEDDGPATEMILD